MAPAGWRRRTPDSEMLTGMTRIGALADYLRESLWFIPSLFAVASIGLAAALLAVDDAMGPAQADIPLLYGGGVDGAREVLSTIAGAMLTFTGLVFTVTMLVLQMASGQLSPRVMRTFLRDRGTQFVLGIFVATFLYTLVVLRYVRSPAEDGNAFVPGLAIGVGFLLLLASVGAFVYYIDHMAQTIRAGSVIHRIAAEARNELDELYPEPIGEPVKVELDEDVRPRTEPAAIVPAPGPGVLLEVDEHRLLNATRSEAESERLLELVPVIGDYVPEGAPLFRLWGDWSADEREGIARAVQFGSERTVSHDLAFGFRQLVDIAERALSTGVNDPTTAVQALDRIHDLLRRLAGRHIPSPIRRGPGGSARLLLPRPGWEDYLVLGTEEIRLSGSGHLSVMRRMRAMLLDLLEAAPADRRAAVERALARLDATIERGFDDEDDRRIARSGTIRGQDTIAG
jgi:uncharacterized membrane protein